MKTVKNFVRIAVATFVLCFNLILEEVFPSSVEAFTRISICLNGPSWMEKTNADGSREYTLKFFIPSEWNDGRTVLLRFDCINYKADIKLNKVPIGSIKGSFIRHFVDITPFFLPGEENLLEVTVTGSPPNDRVYFTQGYRWKNYSIGILGDVYLECHPKIYVDNTFVITSVRKRMLSTITWVVNTTEDTVNARIVQEVFNGPKKVLSLPSVNVVLKPGAIGEYKVEAFWKNPVLWGYGEYGSPVLYMLRTSIIRNDKVEDVYYTRFGFREFWIDGRNLYLNGKKIFIGHGLLGPVMGNHRSYLTRLYQAFRSINLNGVRYSLENSNNSSTPFEVADELGMFIKPQMFLGGTGPGWGHGRLASPDEFAELKEVYAHAVKRLWNHPSILWWMVDNENASLGDPEVWKQLRELKNVVKMLDPTRPVEHGGDRILALAKHRGIYPDLEMWSTRPNLETMLKEMKEYMYDGTIPIVQDEIYPPPTFIDDGTPIEYYIAYPSIVSKVFSSIADMAFKEITGHYRHGVASAGLCVGLGTYFAGIKGDGKIKFPWDVKRNGAKITVKWPSLSGKDNKISHITLTASQIVPNWFDPSQPVVMKSIVAEKTQEAYRGINGGKDIPPFTIQRPEIIITLSDKKGPLCNTLVLLFPRENLPCPVEGVITDAKGTAWFAPFMPGKYCVKWIEEGEWKSSIITVKQTSFNPLPGYAHIQWFDLGPRKISTEIKAFLTVPAKVSYSGESQGVPKLNTRIFEKKLCGYWPLNEGKGGIVSDLSENPAHGTFVGSAWERIDGRFVAKFNGKGSFIEIPWMEKFSTEKGNEISVELWVKRNDDSPAILLLKRDGGAMPNYQVGVNNKGFVFLGMRLGAVYGETSGMRFRLEPGRWYHIVCTYNSGEVKIYVNGELDIVHWREGIIKNSTDRIWIGRNHGYPEAVYFKGLMGNVKIYNYALSEEEIIGSYKTGLQEYHR